MPSDLRVFASTAVEALQQWYGADSFAANADLYHWDDPDLGALKPVLAAAGYLNAYQDMSAWWHSANALTALIDYMLITNDKQYLWVIDNTFSKANGNAYSVSVGWTIVGAAAGGFWGAVAGWIGGPITAGAFAVVGALVGGEIAVATFARSYYTNFIDDYYDDDAWWALAWIKAYDLTKDRKYLDMAVTIFNEMTKGWDPVCKGGIYWQQNHQDPNGNSPYKNAIANELFLAVAAALFLRFKALSPVGPLPASVQAYLQWAMDEWKWFYSDSKLINSQGLVNDGLNTSCVNDGQLVWTYNQGVVLGALCDLFEITGDVKYRKTAEDIANALIQNIVNSKESGVDKNGILTEWNESQPSADSPQFKGISFAT
jgi:hypothetical protein